MGRKIPGFLLCLVLFSCGSSERIQELGELQPGSHELETGERHRFRVDLDAGEALRLKIDQSELDVEIIVDGLRVDTPVGHRAPERLCFVAERPGTYGVEIVPFVAEGRYGISDIVRRPAEPEDVACAEALADFRRAQESPSSESYARAALGFEKAEETFLEALARRELGSTWLEQAVPAEAIAEHEKAYALAERAESSYLEVSVLNRWGLACHDLGDLDCAVEMIEQALEKARHGGDRAGTAAALTNLGYTMTELGDPHRALDDLHEASELWRELGKPGEQAEALIGRAAALGTLDRHREADDALGRALELSAGDAYRRAAALLAVGWNRYLVGDPALGIAPATRALDLYRDLEFRNGEAGALDRLAVIRAASGDRAGAVENLREVLRGLGDAAGPKDLATASTNLGCLLIEVDPDEAARRLVEGHAFFSRAGDPKAEAHVDFCRARLARVQGDLSTAVARADEALAGVARLRGRARDDGHVYWPVWLWRDYADLAIDLRLEGSEKGAEAEVAEAFEILDRTRAWSLFEQVVARESVSPSHGRIRALQSRINLLAQTRDRLGPGARLDEVETTLRQAGLELEDARAEVRAADRAAGRLGSPREFSVTELQERLPVDAVLLAYRLGAERSDLFAVTRDGIRVFPLADRRILEKQAERFYRSLLLAQAGDAQWRLVAESLGELLLPQGAVPDGVRHLFVMADGLLHYVPFSVLSAAGSSEFVVDEVSVGYLPSVSVFLALDARRRGRPEAEKTLAVFADPVFSREDERMSSGDSKSSSGPRGLSVQRVPTDRLPRLPYSREEASALADLVEPEARTVRLGFDAAKSDIFALDLSRFRILHFATHATIDEAVPELSGLVLSRFGPSGEPLDGELRLHEIQGLRLGCDLAVLSGCQTALGKHVRGNGLLGLTHGFFEAGASQVLVSLWSVDDRATSLLMASFYRRMLVEGTEPAEALRGAQQELRRTEGFESPVFWGPFVLHGAP